MNRYDINARVCAEFMYEGVQYAETAESASRKLIEHPVRWVVGQDEEGDYIVPQVHR